MIRSCTRALAGALGPLLIGLAALGVALGRPAAAHADGEQEATERRERCATRLAIAILGSSPSAALLAAPDPRAAVPELLEDAAFHERFARFVNARFNPEPGRDAAEDASYTLAKHVLANRLPWRDMFVGAFAVSDVVVPDPAGLGYFRSEAWMRRYAGDEEDGYRIVAAYRILQNTTGLELTATTNVEGADLSAEGRRAAGCRGCHYDGWYALDSVAKVLSRREGRGNKMRFVPPTEGPQQILGGATIADDAALVAGLVASKNFEFNVCRLAFAFLYGRAENRCEGPVFDACVDAFAAEGTMQAAVAAVASDPTFCQ